MIPLDFGEISPVCDGAIEDGRELAIFYNEEYYLQEDFTRFASEKFCDRVELYIEDVQTTYDTVASLDTAIFGVEFQIYAA